MRVTEHFLSIFVTFFGFYVGFVKHTLKMWKDTRAAVLCQTESAHSRPAISKSLGEIRTKQVFFILSLSRL